MIRLLKNISCIKFYALFQGLFIIQLLLASHLLIAQNNSWQLWATGLPQGVYPKLAIAKNHDIYYGLVAGIGEKGIIYKSNTNGKLGVFNAMPKIPIPLSITNNIQDIICNKNNEPIVGIFRSNLSEPFIFKFNNNTNVWDIVDIDYPANLGVFCMAISPNGTLWMGAKWSYVYKSLDNGLSYKKIDETEILRSKYPCYYPSWSGVPSDGAIYSINVDNAGRLYVGTEGAGILYSDDEGISFHPADLFACQNNNLKLKDSLSEMKALSFTGNLGALGFTQDDNLIFNGTSLWSLNWKESLGYADMENNKVYEAKGFDPYFISTGLQITKIVTTDKGQIFLHSGSNSSVNPALVGIYTSTDGIQWNIFNTGITSSINGQSQGSLAVEGNTVYFATQDGNIWKYEDSNSTQISDIEKNINLSVYPNPTNELLFLSSLIKGGTITFYNLNSTIIQNFLIDLSPINISSFQSGIYFYKIEFNNQKIFGKIIKI